MCSSDLFTISTKVCDLFYKNKKKLPPFIIKSVKNELGLIEKVTKKRFGDQKNPLIVSIRSGARVSMPGMMDTILNLGLNDKTVLALAKETSNARSEEHTPERQSQANLVCRPPLENKKKKTTTA